MIGGVVVDINYDKAKVSQLTLKYWETLLKLVGVAGNYRAKIALRNNLRDESVSWKVSHVLEKYHGGSMENLNRSIRDIQNSFFNLVNQINSICRRYELPEITEPAKLLNLLQDGERRKYYSREGKKLLQQNKIVPLQDIEKKYLKKCEKKTQ